jgi:hypothetical protein
MTDRQTQNQKPDTTNRHWHVRDGQHGSSAIIFSLVLTAAAFAGIGVVIQRSSEAQKSAKIEQRKDQARQTPFNAAAIAKQLISPGVDDGSILWNTAELLTNTNIAPRIYLDPYIPSQAVITGTDSINNYWKVLESPTNSSFGVASWDSAQFAAQKTISIYTADSNLLVPSNVQALYNSAASALSLATALNLPRTTSTVKYRAKNCDNAGNASAVWTGYYCAEADIVSEDKSGRSDLGVSSTTNQNKNTVSFGLILPPPPPVCSNLTGPADWTAGTNLNLTATVKGVASGYKVLVDNSGPGGPEPVLDLPKTYTAANSLRGAATVSGISVNTSDAAFFPAGDTVTVTLILYSATGGSVTCPMTVSIPAKVTAPKPVCNVVSPPTRAPGTSSCSMKISNTGGPVTGSPAIYSASGILTVLSGVTWSQFSNEWVSSNIPCPVSGASQFQAMLSGPGGNGYCPTSTVVDNGQICTISPTNVGVSNRYMGGAWYCRTNSMTIADAIVLPSDASEISIKISKYGVDDWNPCTSLNGTIIGCNRAERTFCGGGGPGPRESPYTKDISSMLKPGSNSLYVESFNKHTYWSMWINISGTYRTRQATCSHSTKEVK